MEKKDLKQEQEHLEWTLQKIQEILKTEREDLDNLYKEYTDDVEQLWRIAAMKKLHIRNLEVSEEKPYFARIDFQADDEKTPRTIYIGKNGVIQNADIYVTDWRAPICSLYYDTNLGRGSYEAPDGTITGDLTLKRQFEIEKGQLLDYFDVDLVSNDDLLQKYLNENNDARLTSIVATIQKEQNDVIRRKLLENLIIQGVAGSGKTTVALHRIAYLVYNYLNQAKQNQYLVIGPNPVFLKYIQSVLPELDVSEVGQYTFEQFAKDYMEEDIQIRPSDKKVNASIAGKNKNDIDHFKCSLSYKEMLDQFLKVFMDSITDSPVMLGEIEVLGKEEIKAAFEESNTEYFKSLGSRINYPIERLCRTVEGRKEELISGFNNHYYGKFKECKTEEEKEQLRKTIARGREELERNARNLIRRYFNKVKADPTKIYKVFVSTMENFNHTSYPNIKTLKKHQRRNL